MKEGFFTKKETESISRPDGKTYSCLSCGLAKSAKHPRMKPSGGFAKGILNIGISPNEQDDITGEPFTGKKGRFLKQQLGKFGIDLHEDCLNINAVNCYCQKPTPYQIACCRKTILKLIQEKKPELVLLHGEIPTQSVIGHRWKQDFGNIHKWRGWAIPDEEFKTWLCPMLDIEVVMNADDQYLTIWKQDLVNALEKSNLGLPKYKKPEIEIISDLRVLNNIDKGLVAFDYETTGIKPHLPIQEIICTSVSASQNHSFVFMMPKDPTELRPFRKILRNLNIGKIAQNMKFEHTWSQVKLGIEVNHWVWDTMQATHISDNRPGISGLKFQVYVQFGVIDYSSEITPYLHADGSNRINRIKELIQTDEGKNKLLTYCGFDSIYEHRLALLQMDSINYDFLPF